MYEPRYEVTSCWDDAKKAGGKVLCSSFECPHCNTSALSRVLPFTFFFFMLNAMKPISPYVNKATRNTTVFNRLYLSNKHSYP